MALQDRARLVMSGLGVGADTPPNAVQPPLPDGVHARWGFAKQLGFPWYGFYLFRRPHRNGTPVCLSAGLESVPLGPQPSTFLQTTYGDVSSDANLLVTDDFEPPGAREFDLGGRQYVQVAFPGGQFTRRVEVTVGFRDIPGTPLTRVCADFTGRADATLDNPYTEEGATSTAQAGASPATHNAIVHVMTDAGSVSGLDCQSELRIDLPRPSSFAEVTVTSVSGSTTISAFNTSGRRMGRIIVRAAQHQTTVRFTRGPLSYLIISPAGTAAMHSACYERAATLSTVPVTAVLGGVPVLQRTLSGDPGQTASIVLEFDAMDAVQVGTANGVLVDVCYVTVAQDATIGWALVPGFPDPMRLPATHPDYPAGPAAVDRPAAEALALGRVRYGPSSSWAGPPFAQLHDSLLLPLVQGGPSGTAMAQKTQSVAGVAVPPSSERTPVMPGQKYLDFVLLGSLNPAVAQMVGLYWVDSTVSASDPQTYDYLLVADHTGTGGLSSSTVLSQIQSVGFANLDGWISYNLRPGPATALALPQNLRGYALPGGTRANPSGGMTDASNNAGLTWDLQLAAGTLLPGAPVLYHLWRADLGVPTPSAPPASSAYALRTANRPILLTKTSGVGTPQRSASWPPFPLHVQDQALPDGWYAYEVNGIDIFGRHSPNSAPAVWYQWSPSPEPAPWYYQASQGDAVVHPYAVRLLDKIPPPRPTAVEATALDPADPLLLRDPVYDAWFASLSATEKASVIGLRVQWKWIPEQQAQAPDTSEFRIYYQPGRLNAPGGRITAVTPVSATDTDVQTNIPTTAPAGGYVGGALRVGSDSFLILSNDATTPLRLRIRNIGPTQTVIPEAGQLCTIAIAPVTSLGTASVTQGSTTVTGSGTSWNAALVGQSFQLVGNLATYKATAVSSAIQITLDRPYTGSSASGQGYAIGSPLFIDFGAPTAWQERYYVVDYDSFVTVEVDGTRLYEVLLPAAGDLPRAGLERPGRAFVPSLAEAVVYGHIGVSAADDKLHTADDPRWASGDYGGRFGNEGRVGAPAAIFRVLRTPPPAPQVFAEPGRVYASAADYHSESFYTHRWRPVTNLKTHASRALDDTVFRTDWLNRPRAALDTSMTSPYFPDVVIDPRWNAAKRDAVRIELETLDALSFPHDAAGYLQAAPTYRALSDDAQRILAGLQGNEAAFSLLTLQPLDPDDPATADRLGPDTDPSYVPSTGARAYIDTLDGRASNHYFYRAAYVDGAGNVSAWSLASAPVYLRKVVRPRTPVLTKVLGGDRVITLRWAPNREIDLAAYRVYRADTAETARDIRLMTKIHDSFIAPQGPPNPYEIVFPDDDLPFEIDRYYIVTAVDTAGNESQPSQTVIGRAYDDTHPEPPVWSSAVPGPDGALVLSWTAAQPALSCLVQRSSTGANQWAAISAWLPRGTAAFVDTTRAPTTGYDYRLRVLDSKGRQNRTFNVLTE